MNTMKGMRGFIKTSTDKSSGALKGGSGSGPHREGPIGRKASPGSAHYSGKFADQGKFRGSSDKSYRATSTGPAGRIVGNKATPSARGASEVERTPKSPKAGAPQISGARNFGTGKPKAAGTSSPKTGRSITGGDAARGKMESLRGKARTSYEK